MSFITFLGTGTSTGVPQIGCNCKVCTSTDSKDKRMRCSALVETGRARILLDCGPDFRNQMLGRKFSRIDGVLLTHEHYDHVGGLDDLRPFCTYGDVNIYGMQRTLDAVKRSLPYCFAEYRYPGIPQLELCPVEPHKSFELAGETVTPIEVMHARLPILGFRIGNMVYITDMKTIEDAEYEYLKNVDLLVVNGLRHDSHYSHQTIEDACDFARRVGAKRTYITHISHNIDYHVIEERNLPDNIYLAYDGLKVEF